MPTLSVTRSMCVLCKEGRRSDGEAEVDRDDDEGEGEAHADIEWAVVDRAVLPSRLLDEAAARARALRALPPGAQLLKRRHGARLVNVAAVGADPLARPETARAQW